VIVLSYLMLNKLKIESLFFTIAMSLSSTLNLLLKNVFDRERPTLLRLIVISGFSFPSGHAMGSATFFGSTIYIANRVLKGKTKVIMIGLSALFIILISSSRVYLGVHYPTDIIAGIIGGAFCVVLSTLILRHKLKI